MFMPFQNIQLLFRGQMQEIFPVGNQIVQRKGEGQLILCSFKVRSGHCSSDILLV
jgi:hypothetical protein